MEIRYEKDDFLPLLHMITFLHEEEERNNGKFFLIPTVVVNGYPASVLAIRKRLNEPSTGVRTIKGVVSVFILDEMRPLFQAYFSSLLRVRNNASKRVEWDERHQFYKVFQDFQRISEIYFPQKIKMQ